MKGIITKDEIIKENNQLEKLYLDFKDNKLKVKDGVIDFKIFCIFILRAINSTLAWCAGINPDPPSVWIIPTLERWRVSQVDNLACIYMDGKKYECPFTDCETKSEKCFCKRKLDYWQAKEAVEG